MSKVSSWARIVLQGNRDVRCEKGTFVITVQQHQMLAARTSAIALKTVDLVVGADEVHDNFFLRTQVYGACA